MKRIQAVEQSNADLLPNHRVPVDHDPGDAWTTRRVEALIPDLGGDFRERSAANLVDRALRYRRRADGGCGPSRVEVGL